jgi:hypothetical protein
MMMMLLLLLEEIWVVHGLSGRGVVLMLWLCVVLRCVVMLWVVGVRVGWGVVAHHGGVLGR